MATGTSRSGVLFSSLLVALAAFTIAGAWPSRRGVTHRVGDMGQPPRVPAHEGGAPRLASRALAPAPRMAGATRSEASRDPEEDASHPAKSTPDRQRIAPIAAVESGTAGTLSASPRSAPAFRSSELARGWGLDAREAREVERVFLRLRTAERDVLAVDADRGSEARREFNREVALELEALGDLLGQARAGELLLRAPLHRVDEVSGQLERVGLDGRPLPRALEPED